MTNEVRILISAVGTATALSVIKGLKKQRQYKVKIIGIDIFDDAPGKYFVDSFFKVPPAIKRAQWIAAINKILLKEKIDLVIPIIDNEFNLWQEIRKSGIHQRTKIILASDKTLRICQDKGRTVAFFQGNGIPTCDLFSSEENLKFPVFIKPRFLGVGSRDAYKATNLFELRHFQSKLKDNYIVQKFIDGDEYTIDCLADLEGKFITAVIRKRLEIKGGLSVKSEIDKDNYAMQIAKKIINSLKIPGASNIQYFKNGPNYYFIEINPRFAGTHAFTIEVGLNSIYLILQMYLNQFIYNEKIPIKYGLKMVRFWDEIIIGKKKAYTPKLITL